MNKSLNQNPNQNPQYKKPSYWYDITDQNSTEILQNKVKLNHF